MILQRLHNKTGDTLCHERKRGGGRVGNKRYNNDYRPNDISVSCVVKTTANTQENLQVIVKKKLGGERSIGRRRVSMNDN